MFNRRRNAAHCCGLNIGDLAGALHFDAQGGGVVADAFRRFVDLGDYRLEMGLHGDQGIIEFAQFVDPMQRNGVGQIALGDMVEAADDPFDDGHDLLLHQEQPDPGGETGDTQYA